MVAFYCNSNYQLLNALNIIFHRFNRDEVDLFLDDNHIDCERLVYNKTLIKHVNRIYWIHRGAIKYQNKEIVYRISTIYSLINPLGYLERSIKNGLHVTEAYDQIYSADITNITTSLVAVSKRCTFYLYEDGLSGYLPQYVSQNIGLLRKLVYKIVIRYKPILMPEAIFLNQSEIIGDIGVTKIKIPNMNNAFCDELKMIFPITTKDYNKKICWLTLYPYEGIENELARCERIIDNVLAQKRDKVLVRLHPADRIREPFFKYVIDDANTNWETNLMMINGDEFVILSVNSNASYTPKFLLGCEPWVISIHRLVFSDQEEILRDNEEFIEMLKRAYLHKERIMIPGDERELKHMLRIAMRLI